MGWALCGEGFSGREADEAGSRVAEDRRTWVQGCRRASRAAWCRKAKCRVAAAMLSKPVRCRMMASAMLVQVALLTGANRVRARQASFGEGRIADVMVDFDGPVAAVPGEQLLRCCPLGGHRGEAVDVLGGGGAVAPLPHVGPLAGDAEDLGNVGVVEEVSGRGQDGNGALLDAPVRLAVRFLEVAGRVPLPVDGAEELVGFGGVLLDGHQIVGGVGGDDEVGGLARGVQRIDGEQAPRDRHLLEQGAHGRGLAALLVEAEGRDRQPGVVRDQGRRFVPGGGVAVGAADAFAVDRERLSECQPGHREPPQHRLDLFGVDRADHPVQGGFGDRHVAAGPEGLPGADRLQLRLTELSGVLGGGDRAAAVRKPGEDVDGEHRGHRVLASPGRARKSRTAASSS